ncbi:hypothetical protein ACFSKL_10160 [Belliella marina]|uniref:Uncharacterized protein n=1 Tax=Belliella marina TaxID=1644146 RepID=A0ABW4VN68_9BACT
MMEFQHSVFILVIGGVLSILLSIIAYFLKLLVQDIRDLRKDYVDLRELCVWLKVEQGDIRRFIAGKF